MLRDLNTATLPRHLSRCLKIMAEQDLREPENFVLWLVSCEAQRRGLLPGGQVTHESAPMLTETPYTTTPKKAEELVPA